MTVREFIAKAREAGYELTVNDFVRIDGDLTLDGMDPEQWLEAMTLD